MKIKKLKMITKMKIIMDYKLKKKEKKIENEI